MNRQKAYTDLLMRHREMLWRMCWRRTQGDHDRCCDLLQEVSIALWEHLDKLRPDASPSQERAWVYWQARSVFYQNNRKSTPPALPLSDTLSDDVTAEESQHRKELLDELLASLDPEEQRMVQLYLDGYCGDEIGSQMGISRNNYYQRMHRAILKMRHVVLILLAVIVLSAVAFALVPQWRHLFFKGEEPDTPVNDTVPVKPKATVMVAPSPAVTMPCKKTRDTIPVIEPLEQLPTLSFIGVDDTVEKMTPMRLYDNITIAVDGFRLTITGAQGEQIRVYDMADNLVASQKANAFCIIDLFPNTNSISLNRHRFKLQIGSHPIMQLTL